MSQLLEPELRLTRVIREARDLHKQLSSLKNQLDVLYKDLTKSAKEKHQEIVKAIEKSASVIKDLKIETIKASDVENRILGHYKWKNAVQEIFGDDGIRKCFEHMQEADTKDDHEQG